MQKAANSSPPSLPCVCVCVGGGGGGGMGGGRGGMEHRAPKKGIYFEILHISYTQSLLPLNLLNISPLSLQQ